VGQNLTSSNVVGARQAYASLQQELQQFALGSRTQSDLDSKPELDEISSRQKNSHQPSVKALPDG
jgi:hypothetical protein